MKPHKWILFTGALLFASPGFAGTFVMGNGLGAACFQEAKSGRSNQEALKICNLAIENIVANRADMAATYVNRGIVRANRRDFDGAIADYASALRLNPDLAEVFANRGTIYIQTNQYNLALGEFDRALTLELEQPANVYYNRAIVYEHIGETTKAYFDFKKAVELRPNWNLPQIELARFSVQSD